MRRNLYLLLSLTLYARLSAKPPRPSSFDTKVANLLSDMAAANSDGLYEKCHIVPWDFIADMIDKYRKKAKSKEVMTATEDANNQIRKRCHGSYRKQKHDNTCKISIQHTQKSVPWRREQQQTSPG